MDLAFYEFIKVNAPDDVGIHLVKSPTIRAGFLRLNQRPPAELVV